MWPYPRSPAVCVSIPRRGKRRNSAVRRNGRRPNENSGCWKGSTIPGFCGQSLDLDARLSLVRQIAEALQYAHERRLYHRALSPQTILVTVLDKSQSPTIPVKIFDWQTAQREGT